MTSHTLVEQQNAKALPAVGVSCFDPVSLVELNKVASLQTRKDRKYIVSAANLNVALASLNVEDTAVLDMDGKRWFAYQSVYFDTPNLDCYRLAATRRPTRFKVRTRTYVDSQNCVLEVKTKNRRGKTVKHRQTHDLVNSHGLGPSATTFLTSFDSVSPFVEKLDAVLTTEYQRATILFQDSVARATIDASLTCVDNAGHSTGIEDKLIVETKSPGRPTPLDLALWSLGIRPLKVSKYATGIAALSPDLPANRWHRVLKQHFVPTHEPDHGNAVSDFGANTQPIHRFE